MNHFPKNDGLLEEAKQFAGVATNPYLVFRGQISVEMASRRQLT